MTAWSRSLTVAYGVSICESLCIEKITSHICGVEGPTTGAYCKKGKIRRKLRKQTETSGGCGCCCGGGSSRRSSGEVLVPFVSICCKGSTLGKSDSRKRTVYCGNASQNADKEEKYHGQWPHHHDRQLIEEAVNESGEFLVYKVQLLATSANRRTGCGDQKGETPPLVPIIGGFVGIVRFKNWQTQSNYLCSFRNEDDLSLQWSFFNEVWFRNSLPRNDKD